MSHMLHDVIRMTREDGVAVLTIDHPPANAVSGAVIAGLTEALHQAENDASCGAVVLTGAGPKFFSAGADITEFGAGAAGLSGALELTLKMEESRLPIVAAVNGIAFGGGCELALACDVRIASSAARFGQPEIKLGIIPGWGGTQRLPRLIGKARAAELLLTGDPIGADRALEIGLISEIAEPEQLLEVATRWAALIASRAPLALAATKRAMVRGAPLPISEALDVEQREFIGLFATEDAAEGIDAFMQKRRPQWKGK